MLPGQRTPPHGQGSGPSTLPPSPGTQHSQSPGLMQAGDFSDFQRAVRIAYAEPSAFAHDVHSAAGQGAWSLRIHAEQYLLRLKSHPQLWPFVCSVLARGPEQFVAPEMFWCCGALVDLVSQGAYASLADNDKGTFEQLLMQWVYNVCPHVELPCYVRNKFSQLMVVTLQQSYPDRWQTFFEEMFVALDRGDSVLGLWLRILETIDEIIVDKDTQASRPAADRIRDARIKDAMREACIQRVVATWYQVCVQCHTSRPDICNQALQTMCPYVEWIDIDLVSTEAWVHMLYDFLSRPELREMAVDVILTLCEKKIANPMAKLSLLTRLRVTDAMPNVVHRLLEVHRTQLQEGLEDFPGVEFLRRTAELVQGVGLQLTEVVGQLLAAGAQPAAQEALKMLNACLPMLWQLLLHGSVEVSLEVCEHFTRRYIELHKKQEQLPRAELARILQVVRVRLQYHPLYDQRCTEGGSDYEALVEALRKQLLIVFRNVCSLEREGSCVFVLDAARAMLEALGRAQWYEVEAVLRLIYTLGEELGATLTVVFRTPEAPLTQLLTALVDSPLGMSSQHPAVALAYIECLQRFHSFFVHDANRAPKLLQHLLGEGGVQHPVAKVRSRACGTFAYLAKALKQQLVLCIGDINGAVQQLLDSPVAQEALAERDRCALYETLGVLVQSLSHQDLPQALAALTALSGPLVTRLRERTAEPLTEQGAQTIAALIASIAALSKGFSGISAPAVGRAPGEVLMVWAETSAAVAAAVERYQRHLVVRDRALLFAHRMIDLQGKGALELVSGMMRILLPTADITDIAKVVRIPTQLLQRIKADAVSTVEPLFGVVIQRTLEITSPEWLDKVELMHTEQAREHLELLRALFSLFLQASQPECVGLFVLPGCQPHLNGILELLLRGCVSHPEMEVVKPAYQVLSRMAAAWIGSLEGFGDFVAGRVLGTVLQTARRPWFSPADAKVSSALVEIGALLQAVLQKVGDEPLSGALAQQWGVDQGQALGLLQGLKVGDPKQSRNALRGVVAHLRQTAGIAS
eukprot:Hpha_TRINITY_DN15178_c4_g6::TRINITY_DN15178_c4_g6_i1::g.129708::m.129708/K14288/XPOT; exportin-T